MSLDYTRTDQYWVKVLSGRYRNHDMRVIGICNEFPDMLATELHGKSLFENPTVIFLGKHQVKKLSELK